MNAVLRGRRRTPPHHFRPRDPLETVLKLYFERSLQAKIHNISSRCCLFIDEIQCVNYWQDIVERFCDANKRLKFVLTGSQSLKLRGKSKESLAGRLIEYHIQPMSFEEYRVLLGKEPLDTPSAFDLKEVEWLPVLQDFQYKAGAKIEAQMPACLSHGQFPEVVAESNTDISYRADTSTNRGRVRCACPIRGITSIAWPHGAAKDTPWSRHHTKQNRHIDH